MNVVETIRQFAAETAKHSDYQNDSVTLTWEERRQGHGKRRSDAGLEFAISLPSGSILKNGDCFVLEAEKTIISVREALEPVFIVRPNTPREWAYYAYHVGNRHQAVMIGEAELIFLQNPAVQSLLQQMHVPYTTDARPFTAALVGHQH